MKKQLILLAITIIVMAIGGCTRNPTDDQISSSGSSGDLSIQAIAQSLVSGTLDQATFDQLLRTDEDWRKLLRGQLLQIISEEDVMTNEQIYAVVGPPEGWSISAEEINAAGQQELEQLKNPERGADYTVSVPMPTFYSQLSYSNSLGYNYDGTAFIYNYGCNLCCTSMLYAKWGVPQMNPPALNNWAYGGAQHYAFSTAGNGDLIRLPQAIQYPGICGPYYYYVTYGQILAQLQQGRPVKAKTTQYGGHYVLIFAYNAPSSYIVKDPAKTAVNQNQPLTGSIQSLTVCMYQ